MSTSIQQYFLAFSMFSFLPWKGEQTNMTFMIVYKLLFYKDFIDSMNIDPGSAIWGYGFGRISAEEEFKKMMERNSRLIVDIVEITGNRVLVYLKNVGNRAVGWMNCRLRLRLYEIFKEPEKKKFLFLEVIKNKELIGEAEVRDGLAPNEEKIVEIESKRELKEGTTYKLEAIEIGANYEEELLARLTFDPAGFRDVIIKIPKEIYLKLMELCNKEKLTLPDLLNRLIEYYESFIRNDNKT